MAKSGPRAPRRRANRSSSHTAQPDRDATPGTGRLAAPAIPDPTSVLDRILESQHIAHVVPRLQPEMLHRIIQHCGLEQCGELLALATPAQLVNLFDLDLWHSHQPGAEEQFDADRFGVWIEVLVESGAAIAAEKLASLDVDLVTGALARHARVFDAAAVSPAVPSDGEEPDAPNDAFDTKVGGYLLDARRHDSWDAIVAALVALEEGHRDYFHRVMSGCRKLSNSLPEIDGLDDLLSDQDQIMFDLAVEREARRERHGFVTPVQARAFLDAARQPPAKSDAPAPGATLARAYFRAIEPPGATEAAGDFNLPALPGVAPAPEDPAGAIAEVVELLFEAGVLPAQPRALLAGREGEAPRLARIRALLQYVSDADEAAYSTRNQELAYLANAIMAGCSIQARSFTAQEASDAAVATCNLGLENQKARVPDDFLVAHDLVSVFQVGWRTLHEDVCMYAAQRLIGVLREVRCEDRETQAGLTALRIQMTKHHRSGTPWRARDAMDVLTTLDMPAWAALLGLIDECPVLAASIGALRNSHTRAVSASAFEFISENSQIASVREFLDALPEILQG